MKVFTVLFWGVLIAAAILRLAYLGSIPQGVTNDEAGYIYSAYSIWHTGKDVAGKVLPLSINLDNSFSPVYIYTIAPFVGLFGISPLTGRLPFALLGIGTVILVFFLARTITNDRRIALLTMAVIAFSPWHIHISRGAFDATFALFFYVLGIWLFIRAGAPSGARFRTILWALPAFLLAFYSYHGTKVYFIFLIPLLLVLYRKELLKRKRELVFFIIGCLTIIGSFLYISSTQSVTRGQVFLWNNADQSAKIVDWERDRNSAPFVVRKFFNNKALYSMRVFRENYLEVFSTNFLFLYGETGGLGGTYGTFYRGVLYLIELPLLILGSFYLLSQKKRFVTFVIFGLLVIAPLPSAFTIDKTYVMRSVMLIPFLAMIVAYGINYLLILIGKQRKYWRKIYLVIFILSYSFFVIGYAYQYFFRYSIYGAEAWFYSSRELAKYVYNRKDKYETIIIAKPGMMFLMQYGLYNQLEPNLIQKAWAMKGDKRVGNVLFSEGCFEESSEVNTPKIPIPENTLYIVPEHCHEGIEPVDSINDLGEPIRKIWKVYDSRIITDN